MVNALIRGNTAAASESVGTQTITVSDMTHVQPKGARIYAVWQDTVGSGAGRDHARWSDYFVGSDGSTAGCSTQDEHGVGTTNTDKLGANDGTVVQILDPSTGKLTKAEFSQWVNGGIEIDWLDTNSDGVILHVEFWFGDNVQATAGQSNGGEISGPSNDVDLGYRPDHIETVSHFLNFNENVNVQWDRQVASIVRTPGLLSVTGAYHFNQSRNGLGTSEATGIQNNGTEVASSFRGGGFFTFGNSTSISTMLTDGFRVTSSGPGPAGATGPRFAWLAISYGNGNRYKLERRTVPTTDGIEYLTTIGFRPWSIVSHFTVRTSASTATGAQCGAMGKGFTSEDEEFCATTQNEHGSGTTDTSSRSVATFMSQRIDDDSALAYEATIDNWHGGGVDIDWSNTDGSAYRYWMVLLERDQIIGCGESFLPLLQSAGTGLVGVIGSGAGTLPLLQGAGTGFVTGFVGTGAGTLPLLRSYAAGRLLYYGCAHGLLPNLQSAGVGTQTITFTGTGAGDLPLLEGSGLGTVTVATDITGTGAGTLPLLTGYGTGRQVYRSMSGCTILPPLTGAGAAALTFSAAGAGTLPVLDGAGLAAMVFIGAGAPNLPLLQGSGAGLETFAGAGAGVLPLPLGTGTAVELFSAAGAGLLPLPLGAGAALVGVIGSGNGFLPLLQGSGTGSTDTLPFACEVEFTASRDQEAVLTASRDQEADLTASRDQEAELTAGRAIVANLLASYDGEANLLGSCD